MPDTAQSIHLERIAPGRAPGGVWIRICTLERLLSEYALTDPDQVDTATDVDAGLVLEQKAETVWTFFYDGDSGECMNTLISNPRTTK